MTKPLLKYSVYGFVWETDLRLESCVASAEGETEVRLRRARGLLEAPANCLFTSPLTRNGAPLLKIYGTDQNALMSYPRLVDIAVTRTDLRYLPAPDSDMALIESQCLGPASALWLELNDILALHASAVVVDDAAIVFLAASGGGKSTLTAAFLSHRHSLLTDDILAVDATPQVVWGRPGYPQLRLFPGVAHHFVANADTLAPVHARMEKKRIPVGASGLGAFYERPAAISHIYVLNRVEDAGTPITIRRLAPSHGLRELIRGSSAAHTVEALGLQPQRMPGLARIAESVCIRHLTYPHGINHLNDIYDAVIDDIDATHRRRFH